MQSNVSRSSIEVLPEVPDVVVLVIDDSPDDREICVRALKKISDVPYRCEEASEGQSGLDMIASLSPHCVLLDYSLPGHNGLEVLRRIRAEYPFLPVILMTGNGSEIVAARAIKDGASDYFTKSSVSPEILHRGIESAIEHGMTARALFEKDEQIRHQSQALTASEARYRSLYNRTPAMMQSVDSDGRLVSVSDLWCETLGYRREDALGQRADAFMTPDSRERFVTMLLPELKRIGHIVDAECQIIGSGGSVHDALFSAVMDGGEKERNQAYLSVLTDVTQKKALEAQLRQAQKMEAVGQLTGGIAHDFNNLLAVIIGNLDIVVGQLPDQSRELVETAIQASEKGAALTHRLLAYARKQTLRPRKVELNTLVKDMEELLRRTIGGSIEIVLALNDDVPSVLVDKEQLENAVLNLAINARDAMPEGGRLTIATERASGSDGTGGANTKEAAVAHAVLAVRDTGTGMSPEVLKRVTEPFFTTKDTGKGSGLGLSMVDGFAKQSGGALLLESAVGHGTTVRILLPQRETSVSPTEETDKQAHVEPRGQESILVVEDTAEVRTLVVSQLRKLGYQVIEASDGPSAQAILAGPAKIDLLFTDIVMPGGLTGHKLAAEARKLRPSLKTVFTTGFFNAGDADAEASEPGARILCKPYRRANLARVVREALDS